MHDAWLARFDGDDTIRGELTVGKSATTES
jgi:hypothetical protein